MVVISILIVAGCLSVKPICGNDTCVCEPVVEHDMLQGEPAAGSVGFALDVLPAFVGQRGGPMPSNGARYLYYYWIRSHKTMQIELVNLFQNNDTNLQTDIAWHLAYLASDETMGIIADTVVGGRIDGDDWGVSARGKRGLLWSCAYRLGMSSSVKDFDASAESRVEQLLQTDRYSDLLEERGSQAAEELRKQALDTEKDLDKRLSALHRYVELNWCSAVSSECLQYLGRLDTESSEDDLSVGVAVSRLLLANGESAVFESSAHDKLSSLEYCKNTIQSHDKLAARGANIFSNTDMLIEFLSTEENTLDTTAFDEYTVSMLHLLHSSDKYKTAMLVGLASDTLVPVGELPPYEAGSGFYVMGGWPETDMTSEDIYVMIQSVIVGELSNYYAASIVKGMAWNSDEMRWGGR